ncbi:MAG: hypothetical protein R3255_09295 [Candidatus Lokiarchaeia archaeon]|nr:hypothetical protein [Candidatus Lokiarchaeia archaeon]
MKKSKYAKSIIIFCVYCLFWVGISIAMSRMLGYNRNLSPIIPFTDPGLEIGFISILFIPLASIIGTLIGGYLFTPLFLFAHTKIFRNRYQYGIYTKPDYKKFKFASQGLFASLMAINISLLLLNPDIVRFITGNLGVSLEDLSPDNYTVSFVVLLIFTFTFTNLFFSPTWFLMDSGILYSNKLNLSDTNKPLEIRSIGRWYEQFLKGYAGVSVLLSYVEFITIFFPVTSGDLPLFITLLIIFIPFPFIMIVPSIPALIILDKIKDKRTNFVLRKARNIGIIDIMDVSIDLRKKF